MRSGYYLWREGSELLGKLKASEALDLLTSHMRMNDGEWSSAESSRIQRLATISNREILAHIFHLLDDDRCFTFVSNLINVARQLAGKKPNQVHGDTKMDGRR
jgi:hypothetical protein